MVSFVLLLISYKHPGAKGIIDGADMGPESWSVQHALLTPEVPLVDPSKLSYLICHNLIVYWRAHNLWGCILTPRLWYVSDKSRWHFPSRRRRYPSFAFRGSWLHWVPQHPLCFAWNYVYSLTFNTLYLNFLIVSALDSWRDRKPCFFLTLHGTYNKGSEGKNWIFLLRFVLCFIFTFLVWLSFAVLINFQILGVRNRLSSEWVAAAALVSYDVSSLSISFIVHCHSGAMRHYQFTLLVAWAMGSLHICSTMCFECESALMDYSAIIIDTAE